MSYTPISGIVPQLAKNAGGASASGYYLKGYVSGSTTPLTMGIDSTPTSTLAKCALNSTGYPISNDADETTIFIPHFNASYKLVLYTNATDADNNTTANAVWVVDNISGIFDASGIAYTAGATVGEKLDNLDVADYIELRAIDVTEIADYDSVGVAYRTTEFDGGGGRFVWSTTDLSTEVTADPLSAFYVAPNSDLTGASGAWVRADIIGAINAKWYGVVGDGASLTDGAITAADNTFTSAGGSFSTPDIGKTIIVKGAGTAGGALITTIASINSPTSIELTAPASTAVAGAGYSYGTDNTAATQAAVDSFTASGILFFPPGGYVVTSPIVMATVANDLVISVEGAGWGTINAPTLAATRFLNGGDGNCFETSILGGGRFSHFAILDTLGGARTQGAGIFCDRISPDEGNIVVEMNNVYVKEHYNGFELVRGVLCNLTSCYAHTNINDGFRLSASSGAGSGTSISFNACFAISNGNDGFTVDGHNYIKFDTTASDGNGRYGYRVHNTTGFNPTAMLFNEAGAEVNTSDNINISDATAVVINGGAMFTSGGNGITLDNVSGASLVSVKMSSNTGYGISATGTTDNVTVVSPHFVANTAGDIDDANNVITEIGTASAGISTVSGSATIPAMGFNSEATGLYLLAANQLGISVGGVRRARLTTSALSPADASILDLGSGALPWNRHYMSGYSEIDEMTAPGAPGADKARVFVRDNGGKTELCAIFSTGAIQVIAAQP